MMTRRIVPHLLGLIASLFMVAISFHAEVEAFLFPVLTKIQLEAVERTSDRLFFRTSFHKAREATGIYSAWAMYGPGELLPGNRYLFTPEQCDTTEPIQGGITPVGTDASYLLCATIPARLANSPIKITGVVSYRVWHGGLVPTVMPVLSIVSPPS